MNATDLACSVFLALPILILIFFVAPSASSTSNSARSLKISVIALESPFSSREPTYIDFSLLPFATNNEESLGEVSPSTVIASKLTLRALEWILLRDF